jgi:hypothetical protein
MQLAKPLFGALLGALAAAASAQQAAATAQQPPVTPATTSAALPARLGELDRLQYNADRAKATAATAPAPAAASAPVAATTGISSPPVTAPIGTQPAPEPTKPTKPVDVSIDAVGIFGYGERIHALAIVDGGEADLSVGDHVGRWTVVAVEPRELRLTSPCSAQIGPKHKPKKLCEPKVRVVRIRAETARTADGAPASPVGSYASGLSPALPMGGFGSGSMAPTSISFPSSLTPVRPVAPTVLK